MVWLMFLRVIPETFFLFLFRRFREPMQVLQAGALFAQTFAQDDQPDVLDQLHRAPIVGDGTARKLQTPQSLSMSS